MQHKSMVLHEYNSPLAPQDVRMIEAFLVEIFEYFDYSLRKALAGRLSEHLRGTAVTACCNGNIVAAAVSLHARDNPVAAILGPVGVDGQYRKQGLAIKVCQTLLDMLRRRGIHVVHLGVKDNVPATNLYRKLGFRRHSGIVMRKGLTGEGEWRNAYAAGQPASIRQLDWGDYAEVSAFLCEPAGMFAFDYYRHLYSSRYAAIQSFLPVFPALMKSLEKPESLGYALKLTAQAAVVGIAAVRPLPSDVHDHLAVLDFMVSDCYMEEGRELVGKALRQFQLQSGRQVLCFCAERDVYKKQILMPLGAKPYAILPGYIKMKNTIQDVIVYMIARNQ